MKTLIILALLGWIYVMYKDPRIEQVGNPDIPVMAEETAQKAVDWAQKNGPSVAKQAQATLQNQVIPAIKKEIESARK